MSGDLRGGEFTADRLSLDGIHRGAISTAEPPIMAGPSIVLAAEMTPAQAIKIALAPPFPTKVRVGFRVYTIEQWDHVEAMSERREGDTCNLLNRIRVDKLWIETRPADAANTLLHEILHACFSIGNIPHKDAEEEATVHVLSNVLCQVWQDNPEVITYLDSVLGKRP